VSDVDAPEIGKAGDAQHMSISMASIGQARVINPGPAAPLQTNVPEPGHSARSRPRSRAAVPAIRRAPSGCRLARRKGPVPGPSSPGGARSGLEMSALAFAAGRLLDVAEASGKADLSTMDLGTARKQPEPSAADASPQDAPTSLETPRACIGRPERPAERPGALGVERHFRGALPVQEFVLRALRRQEQAVGDDLPRFADAYHELRRAKPEPGA
jgi:hypothetical protein